MDPAARSASSWAPVPLGPVLDGTHDNPAPQLLARVDGLALLYPGRVHTLSGEPEACKGWIALAATAQAIDAGERVVYIDFEDTPASVVGRLLALGMKPEILAMRFDYVRPEEPLAQRS